MVPSVDVALSWGLERVRAMDNLRYVLVQEMILAVCSSHFNMIDEKRVSHKRAAESAAPENLLGSSHFEVPLRFVPLLYVRAISLSQRNGSSISPGAGLVTLT
ncbi:hypothetical protein CBL_01522 [Carabus blaptoides fortunei]